MLGATAASSQGSAGLSSTSAGYQTGGANATSTGVGTANVSSITKLTFSNETTSTPSATVATRWGGNGAINGASASVGYICGGFTSNGPGWRTSVDKLTFSSDTVSTAVGATGNQIANAAAFGNSTNIYQTGYFGGSPTGVAPTGLYKMPISTETWSLVNYGTSAGWTNQYGTLGCGGSNGTTAIQSGELTAYMCGGVSGGYQTYSGGQVNGASLTQPMKLNMSNDTMTLVTGADSLNRVMAQSFANGA